MDRRVMRMGVDAPAFRTLMQLMDSAPSQKSMELARVVGKTRDRCRERALGSDLRVNLASFRNAFSPELQMRKIIVTEWMSLDGVVQSPAYADEDSSGGFRHGGWHPRYFDDVSMKWMIDNVTGVGG